MKRLLAAACILALVFAKSGYSGTLTGDLIFYDSSGFQVIPPGVAPITGLVDFDSDTLVINPFLFFGQTTITNVLEILPPGSYSRTGSFGELLSATISPGHVGAYMEIEWGPTVFNLFMGWEVSPDKTVYTAVDVDGDGIPGMMMLAGPFAGISAVYEFTAEPGPGVDLSLVVEGGDTQECATIGGSEVTVNAIALPIGGTVIDSISWTVDGEDAGVGDAINPFLSLGTHTVEAVATTTTGETDSASVNVVVEDTTGPELDIAFLDRSGQEIDVVARPGPVEIRFTATDICDASPVVSNGNAVPAYGVSSGDLIHITPSNARLNLPTTALRVDAVATDASGNTTSASKTLSLE